MSRAFADWFDTAGNFVVPPFQAMLATSIPLIGKIDVKRAAAAAKPAVEAPGQQYSADVLAALAASTSGVEAAGSTPSTRGKKSGGKRRKA